MVSLFGLRVGMIVPRAPAGGAGASSPSAEYESTLVLLEVQRHLTAKNRVEALAAFERLPAGFKEKVFEEVWRICGRPRLESTNPSLRALAHPKFGEVAFYHTPTEGGIERKANIDQIRMAVDLCVIDTTLEALSIEISRSSYARAAGLVEKLPKKIQSKIEDYIRSKVPDMASFLRAKNLIEFSAMPAEFKRDAAATVSREWGSFRAKLADCSEQYETLSSTVSAETLPFRQKAIMSEAFLHAYEFLGNNRLPIDPDRSCITQRAYVEDVIRKNPEVASSLVMIDSTLVDAIGTVSITPTVLPIPAAAQVIFATVEEAQVDELKASMPLECSIAALKAGDQVKGLKEFEKLKPSDQCAVFGEIWRACGRPRPESPIEVLRRVSTRYFGEDVFLGIPSEDGINRSATSKQRRVALELHRPAIHLDFMKELIQASKVPEQVCLLRVMSSGMKTMLQEKLRDILGKPETDMVNYFRDASVSKAAKAECVAIVSKAYLQMREAIEPLCLEYEALVASNTNMPRKIEIIREVLRLAQPFISHKPEVLPDPRAFSSELDYAKACLSIHSEGFMPYLCLVEPSIATEPIAPPAFHPRSLMTSLMPSSPFKPIDPMVGGIDFLRSAIGHNRLATAKIDHRFNSERTTFTHKGSFYRLLSAEVCKTTQFREARLVSMGAMGISNAREAILFDSTPGASPLMEAAYKDFTGKHLAGKAVSTPEVCNAIAAYINTQVFPTHSEYQLDGFVTSEWPRTHTDALDYVAEEGASASDPKSPIIPIDDFIRAKIGMCRHQALVACYFISKLMSERPDIFPGSGKLFHVRDSVFGGSAHVWAWYIHPDGKTISHVDPQFNLAETLELGKKESIDFRYGFAIERQLKRLT